MSNWPLTGLSKDDDDDDDEVLFIAFKPCIFQMAACPVAFSVTSSMASSTK